SLLSDLDEAERDQFPDGGCNHAMVEPVFNELSVRHGQLAVVHAAMVRELDLDAREHLMSRTAQDAEGWRFQHLNQARSELPTDGIPATVGLAHAVASRRFA